MVEEAHIEILETLKEHLQHRWGSAQLEEPRWRIPRMHAEAEYYAQMQAACDHFGSYWAWQQQSRENALRVAREAHCWAQAIVVMWKGHIEWLDHSVSHGQHQSCGCSSSCQHSGSRWYWRSRHHPRSSRHGSCRGQTALLVDCPDDPGRRQTALLSLVRPKRWVTFEIPRDTKTKQVSPPTTPDRQSQVATSSQSWSWGDEAKDLGHPQS